jgi:BirA family biotin operon repressor/biotin-[acetyl-CoA-carboxylase] ligase
MTFDIHTFPSGWRLEHYPIVGSTNDIAKQRARAGEPEGLAVLTDEQSAGRGRMGRLWVAPPGSSLLVSLLLRPSWLAATDAYTITMLGAVALCEAIERHGPVEARLKWPNDLQLLVEGAYRKPAGILCELDLRGGHIEWAVVGMGVNLNWQPSGLINDRDLSRSATSLLAAGANIQRDDLLVTLLEQISARLAQLRAGGRAELFAAWKRRLVTIGQHVTVQLPAGVVRGLVEDVDVMGSLLVRDAEGVVHPVTTGEVEA